MFQWQIQSSTRGGPRSQGGFTNSFCANTMGVGMRGKNPRKNTLDLALCSTFIFVFFLLSHTTVLRVYILLYFIGIPYNLAANVSRTFWYAGICNRVKLYIVFMPIRPQHEKITITCAVCDRIVIRVRLPTFRCHGRSVNYKDESEIKHCVIGMLYIYI